MKYSRILILSIVALFFLVGSAVAIPTYTGSTVGSDAMDQSAAGYYISSDETRTSWTVDWTSEGSESWYGTIQLGDGVTIKLDSSGIAVYNSPTLDFFNYSNKNGFGFTVSGEGADNVLFNIGSTAESYDIYIGDTKLLEYDQGSYYNEDEKFQGVTKSFIIGPYAAVPAPVPEPATMFLLGSGLVGLAGFGRKRFSKKD